MSMTQKYYTLYKTGKNEHGDYIRTNVEIITTNIEKLYKFIESFENDTFTYSDGAEFCALLKTYLDVYGPIMFWKNGSIFYENERYILDYHYIKVL